MRSLIERLSRGRAIRRRLPREFGGRQLFLSPDSALSYLKRNWAEASKELLAAARRFVALDDNIWDIGANVGVFTFAAAHVAGPKGQVVAVEADPFLASLLQKSATHAANTDLCVNIICAAASDTTGIARFMIANRGRSSNSLEQTGHRSQAGGTRYVQYVPTLTLDSLLDHVPAPNVIKIDVEGAETIVLKGAERVLSEIRPLIYIEVGAEQNDDVTQELKRHRYRLFNGDTTDEVELQRCTFNTLAVPQESSWTNKGK